jgi:hypothetical protein
MDAVGHRYKGAVARLDGRPGRPGEGLRSHRRRSIENRSPGKVIFVRNSSPIVVWWTGLLRIADLVETRRMSPSCLKRRNLKTQRVSMDKCKTVKHPN